MLTEPVQYAGQIADCLEAAVIEFQGAVETRQRLGQSPLTFERHSQIVVRRHVVGPEFHGRAKSPFCVRPSSGFQISAAEQIERFVMIGLTANGFFKLSDRFRA